jgi:hypothetical protein
MTTPPDLPQHSKPKRKAKRPFGLAVLGWLLLPFRLIGYLALLIVVVGFTATFGLPALDLCQSNGPGIACDSERLQPIADFGLSVVYLSVFTGIPLIIAFVGLIFLGLDVGRWLHRRLN